VAEAEPRYTSLYVTFRCPETGVEIQSTARLGERTPIGGNVRQSCDFGRFQFARETGNPPFLSDGGPPPKGLDDLEMHIREKPTVDTLPPSVFRHAVVRAFEPVRFRFRWDDEKKRYVGVK
jgi:hypothetical protein